MYYVFHAAGLGATPDGRSAGEMIPANYSPSLFIDQRGPVSVIKSFTKPRLEDVVNGGPLTLEFDQSVFNNEESVRKLGMLVKTYIALGGHQLQLNTVSREKLLDAKVHPEPQPDRARLGLERLFRRTGRMLPEPCDRPDRIRPLNRREAKLKTN